ncbi:MULTISPECIES: hypothetical protein [Nocardiaceae]|uniref:hypothetical protein n=1 Tax=Nocardiaceae TaxID=85025 RepID=UPI00050C81C5|nr:MULTISPECIES: hypothetical protein [Rhodococcus]KQU35771.1 hypothetical protein ASH04_24160 [Rhodococcus sp. Leaf233]
MTTPFETRSPDEIISDLDQAIRGLADLDTKELVFELIDDLRSSYRLAIAPHLVDPGAASAIEAEIDDYVANHYGDN